MLELPELTPEHFEILVVRELRKIGFEVSELRIHRRATLPEPARGFLLELKGVLSRGSWRQAALIGCRRQETPITRAEIESFQAHVRQADVEAGILFAAAAFEPDALGAGAAGSLALLRVTDGRKAFDTSGWGPHGHYPAWLPAYCAQAVGRDVTGQPRYQLLDAGLGDTILAQLGDKGGSE
jgi:hypothetical protein